jgi:hypothetical protein
MGLVICGPSAPRGNDSAWAASLCTANGSHAAGLFTFTSGSTRKRGEAAAWDAGEC